MNLPDTNFWVAAALSLHGSHTSALNWFATQAQPASVLFCRATQQSFLRLLTTDSMIRAYGIPAFDNASAWEVMDGLLTDPRVKLVTEPRGIEIIWKKCTLRNTASPKLWMDAYLAAFAIAGGYKLVTFDKAFTQFQNLNPVILS